MMGELHSAADLFMQYQTGFPVTDGASWSPTEHTEKYVMHGHVSDAVTAAPLILQSPPVECFHINDDPTSSMVVDTQVDTEVPQPELSQAKRGDTSPARSSAGSATVPTFPPEVPPMIMI